MNYRVQMLDEAGEVVATSVHDAATLDGVLVLQLRENCHPPYSEIERMRVQLHEIFPDRKVLILSGDVRFVQIVPMTE